MDETLISQSFEFFLCHDYSCWIIGTNDTTRPLDCLSQKPFSNIWIINILDATETPNKQVAIAVALWNMVAGICLIAQFHNKWRSISYHVGYQLKADVLCYAMTCNWWHCFVCLMWRWPNISIQKVESNMRNYEYAIQHTKIEFQKQWLCCKSLKLKSVS